MRNVYEQNDCMSARKDQGIVVVTKGTSCVLIRFKNGKECPETARSISYRGYQNKQIYRPSMRFTEPTRKMEIPSSLLLIAHEQSVKGVDSVIHASVDLAVFPSFSRPSASLSGSGT